MVLTSVVLPVPGTPSIKTCPPAKSAISNSSTARSLPIIALWISVCTRRKVRTKSATPGNSNAAAALMTPLRSSIEHPLHLRAVVVGNRAARDRLVGKLARVQRRSHSRRQIRLDAPGAALGRPRLDHDLEALRPQRRFFGLAKQMLGIGAGAVRRSSRALLVAFTLRLRVIGQIVRRAVLRRLIGIRRGASQAAVAG